MFPYLLFLKGIKCADKVNVFSSYSPYISELTVILKL